MWSYTPHTAAISDWAANPQGVIRGGRERKGKGVGGSGRGCQVEQRKWQRSFKGSNINQIKLKRKETREQERESRRARQEV